MKPCSLGPETQSAPGLFRVRVPKHFYVSPYSDVDFDFTLRTPGDALSIEIDAYCGFTTFFVWVCYQQTSWLGRTAWFVAIMLLGNIAMSTYGVAELFRVPADGRLTDILTRRHAGPGRLGPALAVLGLAGILLTPPRG